MTFSGSQLLSTILNYNLIIWPLDKWCSLNIFFLFLNQEVYCGYSKELSQ